MVYASSETPYMRLLKPFLDKKKRLGLDKWGRDDTHVGHIYETVIQHLTDEIPKQFLNSRYPHHWGLRGHFNHMVRELLFSEILTKEYASYFTGKSLHELDELAGSFKLENCVRRNGLNKILKNDAGMSA